MVPLEAVRPGLKLQQAPLLATALRLLLLLELLLAMKLRECGVCVRIVRVARPW